MRPVLLVCEWAAKRGGIGSSVRVRHRNDGVKLKTGKAVGTGSQTKKEPHIVWLFYQASELVDQGRPAGLFATLTAAVLPP